MHHSFYGWYMKCQSDTQTLAVIPARADSSYIQVVGMIIARLPTKSLYALYAISQKHPAGEIRQDVF